MNNYKLKKMLAKAGKDLKAAQAKYEEIERCLKSGDNSNLIVVFRPGAYKKSYDEKMTQFKSSFDAMQWLKDQRVDCLKVSPNNISSFISSGDIREGGVIAIPYEDENLGIDTLLPFNVCKILNGDQAICHCRFAIDRVQFSAKESNDYEDSDIRKYLGKIISRFDPAMQEHFMTADITYVDAKDEQLKMVQDKFWLLDQMELFKFYKTMEDRKRTYLSNNAAAYWWLRNPYTGYTYREYTVYTSGSSCNDSSYLSTGCAPACLIG